MIETKPRINKMRWIWVHPKSLPCAFGRQFDWRWLLYPLQCYTALTPSQPARNSCPRLPHSVDSRFGLYPCRCCVRFSTQSDQPCRNLSHGFWAALVWIRVCIFTILAWKSEKRYGFCRKRYHRILETRCRSEMGTNFGAQVWGGGNGKWHILSEIGFGVSCCTLPPKNPRTSLRYGPR